MNYNRNYFREALEPLLTQRRELSRKWLSTLREELGDDLIIRHKNALPTTLMTSENEAAEPSAEASIEPS